MKVLKVIGIIIAVLVVAVVVLGLIAPKDYTVKRSITINAPQNVVYDNIRLFENFNKWEPWGKYDEGKTKVTLEGTDGTVGAKRSWEGPKTGSGSMTIAKLEENKSVTWDLAFLKPFESHSNVQVVVTPAEGGQQQVDWNMNGKMPFPFNAMGLFMNMDKTMGKDFEDGLKGLKSVSEAGGGTGTTAYKIDEIDWTEKNYLSHREVVKVADLPTFFGKHFPVIYGSITKANAQPGIPVGVYYDFDMAKGIADVAAAVPTDKVPFPIKSAEYKDLKLPAGKAYKIDYYGPYEKMEPAYDAMTVYLKEKFNREKPDLVVEEYVGDPVTEKDPSKLLTVIYFFVNDKTASK